MADVGSPSLPRPRRLTPSAFVLIAANMVPLAGVLFFQWSVFDIFLLFWAENVVIGLINVLRMLLASAGDPVSWLVRLFLIPFFIFHYGMFTLTHGLFVFLLFGSDSFDDVAFPNDPEPLLEALLSPDFVVPVSVLFLSHGFSFLWNYVGKGEYRNASLMLIMKRPYGRVVVLHVTLILGGFVLLSAGSPVGGLVLLLLLKVGLDLRAHYKEHAEKLKPELVGEPTVAEILARLNKPGLGRAVARPASAGEPGKD